MCCIKKNHRLAGELVEAIDKRSDCIQISRRKIDFPEQPEQMKQFRILDNHEDNEGIC